MKIVFLEVLFASLIFVSCSHDPFKNKSSDTLFNTGLSLREKYLGNDNVLDEVDKISDELIKRNKSDYRGYTLKGWVFRRRAYVSRTNQEQNKNLQSSVANINKALQRNPFALDTYGEAIHVLTYVGDFEKAKSLLGDYKIKVQAVQNPYHRNRYENELGHYYLRQGRYDEAILTSFECEKFGQNNHQKADCIWLRASSYDKQGKYDESLRAYLAVLELVPESHWNLGNVSGAYVRLGKADEAISYAQKALKLRNYVGGRVNLHWGYYLKGKDSLKKSDYKKALGYYEKVDFKDTDPELAEFVAFDYYYFLGKKDLAIDIIQETIKLNPSSFSSNFLLGEDYYGMQDYEQALPYYLTAIKNIHKSNSKSFYSRGTAFLAVGWIYKEKKDYLTALDYMKKLEALVPSGERVIRGGMYYTKGLCYHELGWAKKDLGLTQLAKSNYEEALKFRPDLVKSIQPNINNVLANIKNFSKLSGQRNN